MDIHLGRRKARNAANILDERCEALGAVVEQISRVTLFRFDVFGDMETTKAVADRLRKISYDFDRASVNLKLGQDDPERLVLAAESDILETFRSDASTAAAQAVSRSKVDGNVLSWLDAIQVKATSIIEYTYELRDQLPEQEHYALGKSLSSIAELARECMSDISVSVRYPSSAAPDSPAV